MITFKHRGDFSKTERFLKRGNKLEYLDLLHSYGRAGVEALANATPVDSGVTASSWDYKIVKSAWGLTVSWFNTNVVSGTPIAIVLQYGHATRNGGFVQGIDYINPAIKPIFDSLADSIWRVVRKV